MNATLLDAPAVASATDVPRQYLRLALGAQMFATPIDSVREILEVGRMTVLPQTPDFVRGVMNLRGIVVPVIDLNARIGHGASAIGRRSCVVVVEAGSAHDGNRQVLGALVDGVHEVVEVGAHDIEPVPPLGTPVDAEFLRGMAHVRGGVLGVLDLERMLAPESLARMIEQHTA